MNSLTHFNLISKICFVLFLSLAFWSCQSKQYNQKVNDLVLEGNNLLKQEEAITTEWKIEFTKVFTPENRAKFPSNREMLRPHAENQIKLLEQKQMLSNSAAEKFEQASQITNNEKERRLTAFYAASFKKDVEIYQLFKEQMKLVFDDAVKDSKTFETKFTDLTHRIELKTKEKNKLQFEEKQL